MQAVAAVARFFGSFVVPVSDIVYASSTSGRAEDGHMSSRPNAEARVLLADGPPAHELRSDVLPAFELRSASCYMKMTR